MSDPNLLHVAALAGDARAVAAALASVPIDAPTAGGETALMLAAQSGDLASVELLLDRGAVVDATTPQGNTALMMAAASGRTAVIGCLVARGAAIGHLNRFGLGPRDWARWASDPAAVLPLLEGR